MHLRCLIKSYFYSCGVFFINIFTLHNYVVLRQCCYLLIMSFHCLHIQWIRFILLFVNNVQLNKSEILACLISNIYCFVFIYLYGYLTFLTPYTTKFHYSFVTVPHLVWTHVSVWCNGWSTAGRSFANCANTGLPSHQVSHSITHHFFVFYYAKGKQCIILSS